MEDKLDLMLAKIMQLEKSIDAIEIKLWNNTELNMVSRRCKTEESIETLEEINYVWSFKHG